MRLHKLQKQYPSPEIIKDFITSFVVKKHDRKSQIMAVLVDLSVSPRQLGADFKKKRIITKTRKDESTKVIGHVGAAPELFLSPGSCCYFFYSWSFAGAYRPKMME